MQNPTPSHWGPKNGIDSKDYLLLMDTDSPVEEFPYRLLSHILTSPSQDLSDPLTIPFAQLKNGAIKIIQRTKRAAQETGLSYTLGFPSALWTPALELAMRSNKSLTRNFYMLYLSPEDAQYGHFHAFEDATLDPPIEAGDLITMTDDAIFQYTTTLRCPSRMTYLHLDLNLLDAGGADDVVNAVAIREDTANVASDRPNRVMAAGGNTAAAPMGKTSLDQFASNTAAVFPAGILAAWKLMDLLYVGDGIYAAFSDVADPFAIGPGPVAGGVAYSPDNGATWVASGAGMAEAAFGLAAFNGFVYVVGTGGAIYKSSNGVAWEEVVNTTYTEVLTCIAVDEDNQLAYIGGANGTALTLSATERLSDISTAVGLVAEDVRSAAVFEPGHVAFGGAGGYYSETLDADSGVWTEYTVGGTTDLISAIAGDAFRVVAGAGNTVYERSLLTGMEFQALSFIYGAVVAGNVMDVALGNDGNFFLVGFDTGEIVAAKPRYPGA